ncbi:MAG TPA: hypothetical protein PK341_19100 [Spirochaetota bacterium]|nr:hypothetical protein [Spirochaetota bacterium]
MKNVKLLGHKVTLKISDPWEFGTECGIGPFKGIIKDTNIDHILIKLENPIKYNGKVLIVALCRPRHSGSKIEDILNRIQLSANILLLSVDTDSISTINNDRSINSAPVIGTVELI